MKNLKMAAQNALSIFLISACLVLPGCDQLINDAVDKCGEEMWYVNEDFEKMQIIATSVEGEYRTLVYENMTAPEDICSEEHTYARYMVYWSAHDVDKTPFTLTARSYWGGFYERRNQLIPETILDKVDQEIGLANVFGPEEPAWLGMQLLVKFKTQGDRAADSAFFHQRISRITFALGYHKHKKI